MFFDILKKDLKRGRTMNTIILLFVIISVMFISGSVISIITVNSSIDIFMDKAGIPEFMAGVMDKTESENIDDEFESVRQLYSSIKEEKTIFMDAELINFANGERVDYASIYIASSIDIDTEQFFTENNKVLKNVEKGNVYIVNKLTGQSDMKVGDRIRLKIGNAEKELTVAGTFKDAMLGSSLMGMSRIILNDEEFNTFYDEASKEGRTGKFYFIRTDNAEELQAELNKSNISFVFSGSRDFVKSSYIMDMLVALILLVVSLILIIVALIVLRFTINFTISSEFREIGVMKAIGIGNMKIRSLYLVKYLAISLVGAVIGTAAGIPFSGLLIKLSSGSIMTEVRGGLLTGILCAAGVVLIIMLYGLFCTGKTKKLSPVDAIRNGQTGERFRKKGFLHLYKSRMNATGFLASNDVLSAPKRYLIIIVVFALTILPIQFLDIVADSLESKEMLSALGSQPSDVVFQTIDQSYMYTEDGSGRQVYENKLKNYEKILAKNNMPGKVFSMVFISCKLEFNDRTTKVLGQQDVNVKEDVHHYLRGTAPANKGEIAIQPKTAKALGADLGDTITVTLGNDKYELMISGIYEAMTNLGEGVRFHIDTQLNYNFVTGGFGIQVNFDDKPGTRETKKRIEKLEELFTDARDIMTGAEAANTVTSVGPMFTTIKKFFIMLSIIIVIMVAVLMERSMIIKETGEIATLKAIGFTDGKIVGWHAKRFIITATVSALIAGTLALPLTMLLANPIFSFMGISHGIKYSFSVLRVCVFYPVLVMFFMTISVWITASITRKIKAQQTSCIE